MSVGVMLTRAQPFHIGHLRLLLRILDENEKALLIIGSADKKGTERNPFDIESRVKFVRKFLKYQLSCEVYQRVEIMVLPDWEDENNSTSLARWGCYLYYNMVGAIGVKKFKYYYADSKKTLESWFNTEISEDVEMIVLDRHSICSLSSTEIREALKRGSSEDWRLIRQSLDYNLDLVSDLANMWKSYIEFKTKE